MTLGLWAPKWGWILPFALVPLLAFGVPLWCEWWGWVVVLVILLTLLAAARHGLWRPEEPSPSDQPC